MKSIKTTIQTLATLLVAVVATTACSSGDDDAVPGGSPAGSNVYTLTVEATKGNDDATTRALSLSDDGKTLNATWTAGDEVEVGVWDAKNKTFTKYGTLTAQGSGISTTFTGMVENIPSVIGLNLRLRYLSNDYSSQTGTLDYIASHCDYATADVKMTDISGSEISTTAATFQNQQAVIKFTVKDFDGSTLNPSAFTVSDGTSTVTLTDIPDATYNTNGDGVLYVAFPATGSSATITLTATIDSRDYKYTKSGVTLENGKYYAIGVKITEPVAPALGDLFYSDGSFSPKLQIGKTPIGVIAYLGTDNYTENGTEVGGSTFAGHGLVLCLKNAANSVAWSTETSAFEFGESAKVTNASARTRTENVSGYTNTTTLAAKTDAATNYPAAYLVKNYTTLPAPTTGTTGWFMPSAQQWVKMMEGLGGLAEVGPEKEGKWFDNNHTAEDKWEAALAKAGSGNYDSMKPNYQYWTSSEYSTGFVVILRVDARYEGEYYGFLWDVGGKDGSRHVRPVLAF